MLWNHAHRPDYSPMTALFLIVLILYPSNFYMRICSFLQIGVNKWDVAINYDKTTYLCTINKMVLGTA